MEAYMAQLDDEALSDEILRLKHSPDSISKACRKRVLESVLVSEIDDLNSVAGYAPSYTDIISMRKDIYQKMFQDLPPPHRSEQMATQWCRRFVRRNSLTRGRIDRQQHESRGQLLHQVESG